MTASRGVARERVERVREDRRIRLGHADRLRHDERVDVRVESAEPDLALLLVEKVVGDDADPDARLERGEDVERAVNRRRRRERTASR